MATAAVTYTFTNNTTADASEVNANFTSLVSFLNNSVVHRDGSKAMTAAFDAGSFKVVNVATPTANTDAATKLYVDDNVASGRTAKFTRTTNVVASPGVGGFITPETESNDDDGWWSSGASFTCPADGTYTVAARLKKSAGSGVVRIDITDESGNPTYGTGGNTTSGTTSKAGVGVTAYFKTGDIFRVEYTETAGLNSATIDEVVITVTRVAQV